MGSEKTNNLLDKNVSTLFELFEAVGITLNEKEQEDFKRGLWAFAKINVDLFNWSLLGDMSFEEAGRRRFDQIWYSFTKSNPEFVNLVNRLKQALYESVTCNGVDHWVQGDELHGTDLSAGNITDKTASAFTEKGTRSKYSPPAEGREA